MGVWTVLLTCRKMAVRRGPGWNVRLDGSLEREFCPWQYTDSGVRISRRAKIASASPELAGNDLSATLAGYASLGAERDSTDAESARRPRPRVGDLDSAIPELAKKGVNTILITTDPDFNSHRDRIAQLAIQNRIAFVSDFREYVDAGGLMSYGASIVANAVISLDK